MKNKTKEEIEEMNKVSEKEFEKTEKKEEAVTDNAKPKLKIVEEGLTDTLGNFVAFVDGKIPDDKKEEAKGLKHKYRTYSDDSVIID